MHHITYVLIGRVSFPPEVPIVTLPAVLGDPPPLARAPAPDVAILRAVVVAEWL